MSETQARTRLRRELEAHLSQLGYSSVRPPRVGRVEPEIVRVSPVRGTIVYGEVVLAADLRLKKCHERLLSFSQRRTRHRSSILFFIGVEASHQKALEALLEQLAIRGGIHGGHVHVVPVATPERAARRPLARPQRAQVA